MMNRSFVEMSVSEKVEFFVQCQRLLIANHPNSFYVCRRNNLKTRLEHIKKLATDYKGYCYQDDNLCALYNKIILTDIKNPESAIRHYAYNYPDINFNSIVVDFAVFRALLDCKPLIELTYDPKLQYVVFVKNQQIKVYPIVKLISEIFKIPQV